MLNIFNLDEAKFEEKEREREIIEEEYNQDNLMTDKGCDILFNNNSKILCKKFFIGKEKREVVGFIPSLISCSTFFFNVENLENEDNLHLLAYESVDDKWESFKICWLILNGVDLNAVQRTTDLNVLINMWIFWAYFDIKHYARIDVWIDRMNEVIHDNPNSINENLDSWENFKMRFTPNNPIDRRILSQFYEQLN